MGGLTSGALVTRAAGMEGLSLAEISGFTSTSTLSRRCEVGGTVKESPRRGRPGGGAMRRSFVIALVAAVIAALGVGSAVASAAPGASDDSSELDAYTAVVPADQLAEISQQGVDISGGRARTDSVELDMVLTQGQAKHLRGKGVDVKLTRVKGGKTVREFAADQAAGGYTVWRSYDEPGGIRDQLYAAAQNNPQLVKLEVLGRTGQGREIIAVKLTQGAR